MVLEIKKITQKDFDSYWTPEVHYLLDKHIHGINSWANSLDTPWRESKWVIDDEKDIIFMTVNAWYGTKHLSEFYWQDVAVVAKDGSVALLKHKHNEISDDVYEILILTKSFSLCIEKFNEMMLKALKKGGLSLDGAKGICNEISENVIFYDSRGKL